MYRNFQRIPYTVCLIVERKTLKDMDIDGVLVQWCTVGQLSEIRYTSTHCRVWVLGRGSLGSKLELGTTVGSFFTRSFICGKSTIEYLMEGCCWCA